MARKRLNKNVVIGISLFTFATVIVLSVIMLRQLQQRDPAHFVVLASQAAEREEWQQAALFYFKAWERGGDASHLVPRGDALLSDGDVVGALQSWRQALRGQPDLIAAHMRLLDLELEFARYDGGVRNWIQVKEAAEALIAVEAERTDAEIGAAHYATGLALMNLANQDASNADMGIVELREAVRGVPEEVEYSIDLAAALIRQGEGSEGERILMDLMERFGEPGGAASKARLAYVRYVLGPDKERHDEAEDLLGEAVRLSASDSEASLEARLGYAGFHAQKWAYERQMGESDAERHFEAAEKELLGCLNSDPDSFDPVIRAAALYKAARRHGDVVAVCEARLSRGFERKGVEATRNRRKVFTLHLEAAEASIALAVAAEENAERDKLLRKAEGYVADARSEFPSHPSISSQAGRIKWVRGEDRSALDDLRTAHEGYRSFDTVDRSNTIILARVHLRLGEAGAALGVLDEYKEFAGSPIGRDSVFWMLYAQVLFRTNEFTEALSLCNRILLNEPDNADVKRLRLAALARLDRPEIVEQFAESSELRAILAISRLILEDDIDSAIRVGLEALTENPSEPRILPTTVNLLLNRNRVEEANVVVQNALAKSPDDAGLAKLAVLVRPGLSEEERQSALLGIILSEEDGYQRALDLIGHYARAGDPASALKYVDEAIGHLSGEDTPLAKNATRADWRALAVAKIRFGSALDDQEALAATVVWAVDENIDGANGKSILGLYHMARNETELAVQALREAVDAQPTDTRSLACLGFCLQALGKTREARTFLQRAIRVNPNEAMAHKALAAVAQREGDRETYSKELAICERLIPNDPWVQAELTARSERSDPEAAIARCERLLENQPDDKPNVRRLAALCELVGDRTKADIYYEKLLALASDDRNVVAEVAGYYSRTARMEKSVETARQFVESQATDEEKAEAMLLVAVQYLGGGKLNLVEQTLLSAADTSETLGVLRSLGEFYLRDAREPKKALGWFDKAVAVARDEGSTQISDLSLARIACALDRSLSDTEKARELVEEFKAEFTGDVLGLFWDARVCAREGRISEAIGALTEYLARRPGDARALYDRALHYIAQGRPGLAIQDLGTIKRTDPLALNLEPRILLARLIEQGGEEEAALRELRVLVEEAPSAVRAAEELVRACIRTEKFEEADQIITARINLSSDSPDPRWFRLRGQVSMELDEQDKALADFQHVAKLEDYSPQSMIDVLTVYRQIGRASAGVKFYEEYGAGLATTPLVASRHALLLAVAGRRAEAIRGYRAAMGLAMAESSRAIQAVTGDLRAAFEPGEGIELFEEEPADASNARANDRILVRFYRMAGRMDGASAIVKRLLVSSTNDRERAGLLQEQGEMHQLAGRPTEARRAYEESLRYDDSDWITLNNLAYLLSDDLGEDNIALPYARRAVALIDRPETLDTLGWILVGLKDYQAGIAELSRALQLDPNQSLAYYHLGEAYRRGAQFDEAANILFEGQRLARLANDADLLTLLATSLEKTRARTSTP